MSRSPAVASTSQIVDALLARLRSALPSLNVEHCAAPADYRLEHPQGALLLSYRGSQFALPRDVAGVCQLRTLQLELTLLLRRAGAQVNDTEALDAARRACLGFSAPDCRPACLSSETFLGFSDGIARYAISLAAETLQVAEAAPGHEPVLTAVTKEEQS
ncbi:hypothetical protein VK98_22510 [Chromobacterium sp. LK11]|nr:hypothetical protein VK98_22510 [Chromobacterium sp. LK11]